MSKDRKASFGKAFENIHVTGAVGPGFFDKYEDPIGRLGQFQKSLKNHAVSTFAQAGVTPEHLKGINTVVLHENQVFGNKSLAAAYVPTDSSMHININHKKVLNSVRHEVGHHVAGHKDPTDLSKKVSAKEQLHIMGRQEAEADHFANPNNMSTNRYAHAAMHHTTGSCTDDHGDFSHKQLKHLGAGYLEGMKRLNPTIHGQLTGTITHGN